MLYIIVNSICNRTVLYFTNSEQYIRTKAIVRIALDSDVCIYVCSLLQTIIQFVIQII